MTWHHPHNIPTATAHRLVRLLTTTRYRQPSLLSTTRKRTGDASTTWQWAAIRLVAVLVVSLLVVSMASGVAAGADEETPETGDEFLDVFQALEGTDSFETYSELEVVRSSAVQDAQVGEFTATTEQRLELVLSLLEEFDRTAQLRAEVQPQEADGEVFESGTRVRNITEQLRQVEDGEEYALLADIALDRLFTERAETLLAEADQADTTPEQLRLLSLSATGYDKAGATERLAEVEVRRQETNQTFARDRVRINETAADLDRFLDRCVECDSLADLVAEEHVSVFGLYTDSLSLDEQASEAISLAARHGLDDRETELRGLRGTVDDHGTTLGVTSAVLVQGYSAATGLVVALVTWRLMIWRRDVVDSQRGDVVLLGEMLNA